jgi:hypothetical protein
MEPDMQLEHEEEGTVATVGMPAPMMGGDEMLFDTREELGQWGTVGVIVLVGALTTYLVIGVVKGLVKAKRRDVRAQDLIRRAVPEADAYIAAENMRDPWWWDWGWRGAACAVGAAAMLPLFGYPAGPVWGFIAGGFATFVVGLVKLVASKRAGSAPATAHPSASDGTP